MSSPSRMNVIQIACTKQCLLMFDARLSVGQVDKPSQQRVQQNIYSATLHAHLSQQRTSVCIDGSQKIRGVGDVQHAAKKRNACWYRRCSACQLPSPQDSACNVCRLDESVVAWDSKAKPYSPAFGRHKTYTTSCAVALLAYHKQALTPAL